MTLKKSAYLIPLIALSTILLSASALLSGQIYIWTDERGIVHLTNIPSGNVIEHDTDHEVIEYKESPTVYEPNRYDIESLKQRINRAYERTPERPRQYQQTENNHNTSMNAYYEKTIEKLKIDKEKYKNKIAQPHSINDYEYYNDRLRKIDIDIQYYRSKIK